MPVDGGPEAAGQPAQSARIPEMAARLQYVRIHIEPADMHAISTADHAALRPSSYPKLLFCGDAGALISPAAARSFAAGLQNCRLVEFGAARPAEHRAPEAAEA